MSPLQKSGGALNGSASRSALPTRQQKTIVCVEAMHLEYVLAAPGWRAFIDLRAGTRCSSLADLPHSACPCAHYNERCPNGWVATMTPPAIRRARERSLVVIWLT